MIDLISRDRNFGFVYIPALGAFTPPQMLRDITTSGSAVINTGAPIPINSCLRHPSKYRQKRQVHFDPEGMFGPPPPPRSAFGP